MGIFSLGTAQFGSAYGVKQDGQPDYFEVARILYLARWAGIDMVDTAPAYGRDADLREFKVVTKTPWDGSDCYAVLVHDPDGAERLPELRDQRGDRGVKIGISVYTPDQMFEALRYNIEVIQIPLNIVDGRFLPYLSLLHDLNVEVHARSAFLQGALLMDDPPVDVPTLDVETCLGYALAQDVDRVVVGVNSEMQLWELLHVPPKDAENYHLPESAVDPRGWGK